MIQARSSTMAGISIGNRNNVSADAWCEGTHEILAQVSLGCTCQTAPQACGCTLGAGHTGSEHPDFVVFAFCGAGGPPSSACVAALSQVS